MSMCPSAEKLLEKSGRGVLGRLPGLCTTGTLRGFLNRSSNLMRVGTSCRKFEGLINRPVKNFCDGFSTGISAFDGAFQ